MCLHRLNKAATENPPEYVLGYKCFYKSWGGDGCLSSSVRMERFDIGKTRKARTSAVLWAGSSETYKAGFHVFATEKAAIQYRPDARILPVVLWGITAVGTERVVKCTLYYSSWVKNSFLKTYVGKRMAVFSTVEDAKRFIQRKKTWAVR